VGSASGSVVPDPTTETVTETIRVTDGSSLDGQSLSNGSTEVPEDCPADNTAVVAGSVGGVLGAALLASLGVIAVLWRRRQPTTAVAHHGPAAFAPAPMEKCKSRENKCGADVS
jgi:hypothetical protein